MIFFDDKSRPYSNCFTVNLTVLIVLIPDFYHFIALVLCLPISGISLICSFNSDISRLIGVILDFFFCWKANSCLYVSFLDITHIFLSEGLV